MASRTLPACLCLAASLLAGPAADDPKEDPAFKEEVNGAIAKGVAWLLARQDSTGKFPGFEDSRGEVYPLGMHALCTLTVIKGGHPVDSDEVRKAFRGLASLYGTHRNALKTYEVGSVLMLLDAKYNPPEERKRRKKPKVSEDDRKLAEELVKWLQIKQRPDGMWRYPEGGEDLSNTQYAALGLWAAHRMDVDINKGVVRRMMEAVLERQAETGAKVPLILDPAAWKRAGAERRSTTSIEARGWRYVREGEVTRDGPDGKEHRVEYPYSGSMTAAGVAVLGIGRDILGDKDSWLTPARDREVRKAIWEGLAWLQANWDLNDNPGQRGNWPFYWIYGLERAARVSGVEYVGLHDWYHEGALRLLADQRPDGSWPKNQRMRPPGDQNVRWWSDQVDTCFAVLFLTKSTPEIRTPPPVITGGSD